MAKDKASFAQRYGIAFFETLLDMEESVTVTAVGENFEVFLNTITQSDELRSFLSSPAFEVSEKQNVIKELEATLNLEPAFCRFLNVLVEQGHFDYYAEIVASFDHAVLDHQQKISVHVTSAFALSDEQTGRISYALSQKLGKDIMLDIQIDPALVGGLKAEVGGVIYDASIKGKLNSLLKEIKS